MPSYVTESTLRAEAAAEIASTADADLLVAETDCILDHLSAWLAWSEEYEDDATE